MDLETRLLHQIDDSALDCSERAWLRCELARRLEEAGDYEAAREALGELWPRLDDYPLLAGLDRPAAGEVLLRVGVLLGWVGSTRRIGDAQRRAKKLIDQSVRLFEGIGEGGKVAEALTDLAYCHWREGAFDAARATLRDALSRLGDGGGVLRATALIRAAIVEKEATRYGDALGLLRQAEPLVAAGDGHALRGKFHNELATVLGVLGAAERREDYTDRALVEYAAAGFHFEQAGHTRYRACVESNTGTLLFDMGRFAEAHEHLGRARLLLADLGDDARAAQVDETRARVLLADGRGAEAERVARAAAEVLGACRERHLLAEALTTWGAALARTNRHARARAALQSAAETALEAGDPEAAGLAALTSVEELGERLTADELTALYDRAADLLARSQHPGTLARLSAAARLVFRRLMVSGAAAAGGGHAGAGQTAVRSGPAEDYEPAFDWEGFSLQDEWRRFERSLIERALKDARGAVTQASRLLGFKHYQSFITLLNARHRELLPARTPAVPRRRSVVSRRGTREIPRQGRGVKARPIRILHAEDDGAIADAVGAALAARGWEVDLCDDGAAALRRVAGRAHYDLLLVDDDLPGAGGLEIVRRARELSHRRRTPIVMLAAGECEHEAWRAGVDAFLRKPDEVGAVAEMVTRLLPVKHPHRKRWGIRVVHPNRSSCASGDSL